MSAAVQPAVWLADVLRAGGQVVVEHQGWEGRGRPASTGGFVPRAVVVHHDASAPGPSPKETELILGGRAGIPGPLSQLWLDTFGRWHVLAAGRCNHAGTGAGWGVIPKDSGNTYALGIETDHTVGEPWPVVQYQALIAGTALLARYMKIDARRAVCGHREYAPGRKIDPAGVDLDAFRADVTTHAVQLLHAGVVNPDGGPWGPWPYLASHRMGFNLGKRSTWHDGTASAFDAAMVHAWERETHAPSVGHWTVDLETRIKHWQAAVGLPALGSTGADDWKVATHR